MINFPQFIPETARRLAPEEFLGDTRTQTLCRILFDRHAHGKTIDPSTITDELEDEDGALTPLAIKCAKQGFDEGQVERLWREPLLRFQSKALKKRIDNKEQALAQASDDDEKKRLQAEHSTLCQERKAVEDQLRS